MDITITPIEGSSNICGIGYDEPSQTLAVDFGRKGAIYHYANVPKELHAEFIGAESKGKFFASEIKGKYDSTKLPEVAAEASAAS